jgi:hypothetical protein
VRLGDSLLTARRAVLAALALLSLTACGSHASTPSAQSPTPTPGSATTSTAPTAPTGTAGAPSGSTRLHAISSPRHVTDDAHLQAGQCHVRQTDARPLPDPVCTPGAIDPAVNQSNIKTTICRPGYTAAVRPPASDTGRWKRTAQAAYGVSGTGEYDHLVPLELGGANATSNLWVEPGSIPNPKDKVENRLHDEVCAGKVTLAAAQQAIATNWTTAP